MGQTRVKLHYDFTKQIESVKLKYLDKYRIFKFGQKSRLKNLLFFKSTFRDSAPHNSQSPAQFLNKMTSILKEKVFMVNNMGMMVKWCMQLEH